MPSTRSSPACVVIRYSSAIAYPSRMWRLGEELLRLLYALADRWHGVDKRLTAAAYAHLPVMWSRQPTLAVMPGSGRLLGEPELIQQHGGQLTDSGAYPRCSALGCSAATVIPWMRSTSPRALPLCGGLPLDLPIAPHPRSQLGTRQGERCPGYSRLHQDAKGHNAGLLPRLGRKET